MINSSSYPAFQTYAARQPLFLQVTWWLVLRFKL